MNQALIRNDITLNEEKKGPDTRVRIKLMTGYSSGGPCRLVSGINHVDSDRKAEVTLS